MNVTPQQRATIVAQALARGAAALKSRGTAAPAGPTMTSAQQRPDGPPGFGITPANADSVAADLRDLAAWIGKNRSAGPTAHRARPTTARNAAGRAPRSDAEKAVAISATWATLRARQQQGAA